MCAVCELDDDAVRHYRIITHVRYMSLQYCLESDSPRLAFISLDLTRSIMN